MPIGLLSEIGGNKEEEEERLAAVLFLERRSLREFDYWPLAVSMPPTKVYPQCKAAVPVRWKTCERCDHVFRSKGKAECNVREKAMKHMRAVE